MTTIRIASASDAHEIAKLHASSWRIAYRGLLTDLYLDNDLAGERSIYWTEKMTCLSPQEFVLIAEDGDGRLEGFIAVMDQPEKTFAALVDNLHVRPDLKGKGIGRMLMQAAARKLLASGRSNYYLWVLNGNDPAARFYESIGGVAGDQKNHLFGGKEVAATRYGWDTFNCVLG